MKIDREILFFLWRWKLVSSTGLAAKFFPGLTNSGANMRLEDLRKQNLIFPYYMNTTEAKVLWGLTSHGFKEAKIILPTLSEEGFRSEHPLHDFYVTAMHLGEWLKEMPEGCDLFSEQELRRIEPSQYPKWVPNTSLHRPDGYWKISLEEGTVIAALEVELNTKGETRYAVVAQFYKDQPDIGRVIWLVRTKGNAQTIHEQLKSASPSNIGMHTFVLLSDFLSMGWQAPIINGFEKGESVSCLLRHADRKSFENSFVFSMLDTRKTPAIQKPLTQAAKSSISLLAGHCPTLPGLPSNNVFNKQAGLPRSANRSKSRRKT